MNQTIKNKINELKKSGLEISTIKIGDEYHHDWAVKVYKGNEVVCRDEGLTSEINAYETGIDYAEKYLKRTNKNWENNPRKKIEKIEDLIPFLGTNETVLVNIFRKLDDTAEWEEKRVVGIDLLENKVKVEHGEKGAMNHITDWYSLYFQRNKQMDPIYFIKLKDDK